MKIIMAAHEFPLDGADHHGGIATYTQTMAEILKNHGNEVTVLVLSWEHNDTVWWKGIRVERIQTPAWMYRLKYVFHNKFGEYIVGAFLIRRRLDRLCKGNKPDIVHYANFKCIGLFRRKDIPCVVRLSSDNVLWRETYKETYDFEDAYSRTGPDDWLEMYVNRRADGIFAPSKLVAGITARRIGKDVKVIETPPPPVNPASVVSALPENLRDRKYFLYFGSLSRMKGIHIILEALSGFLEDAPDCSFVFVGHDYGVGYGRERKSFRSYALGVLKEKSSRVIFFDYLPWTALQPVIENAMCCVFPSRIDNIPNTCLEAMSLAKPVIATEGASFEQLLKNGESGLLVPIEDEKALREAMKKVYRMGDGERASMGQRAKIRLRECAPDKIYQEMIQFYKEVIHIHETNRTKRFSQVRLSGDE